MVARKKATMAATTHAQITDITAKSELLAAKAVAKAWREYQPCERKGLAFGKVLYAYRKQFGAQGKRGAGLPQILSKLGCKEGKAYYWITQYEISIGEKREKISYRCSICEKDFDCTADKVPPHYALHPATHGTWHPPINSPDIKGWSSMNSGEKQAAARAAGCPYCLKFNSSRSCPAHGWTEKRDFDSRIDPTPVPAPSMKAAEPAPRKFRDVPPEPTDSFTPEEQALLDKMDGAESTDAGFLEVGNAKYQLPIDMFMVKELAHHAACTEREITRLEKIKTANGQAWNEGQEGYLQGNEREYDQYVIAMREYLNGIQTAPAPINAKASQASQASQRLPELGDIITEQHMVCDEDGEHTGEYVNKSFTVIDPITVEQSILLGRVVKRSTKDEGVEKGDIYVMFRVRETEPEPINAKTPKISPEAWAQVKVGDTLEIMRPHSDPPEFRKATVRKITPVGVFTDGEGPLKARTFNQFARNGNWECCSRIATRKQASKQDSRTKTNAAVFGKM
jgi:hypothetical protein